MEEHILKAGAGKAEVKITDDMLPLDGFTSVRDPLHIRVLILESNVRFVIVSIEITSIFDSTQERMLNIVCEECGAARENVWLTLTHSFAGPHIWSPERTGGRPPEVVEKSKVLEAAYLDALRRACAAAAVLKDAVTDTGAGVCHVNASRNMLTKDGWWLGTDAEEPCDHSLRVFRVEGTDGTPIAALLCYGARSDVMFRVKDSNGGGVISSDLCGAACTYLEKEFGGGFTALFLSGAVADQEPQLKGVFNEIDKDGVLRSADFSDVAGALLDAQGARLGAEALKVYRRACNLKDIPVIIGGNREITVQQQRGRRETKDLKPARTAIFEPGEEKMLRIWTLSIGQFHLIGVQPELCAVTTMQLACTIPGEITAAVCMVNGCDKCMPEEEAYESVKYQCLNSPYMPGSAEKVRDAAMEQLRQQVAK